MIIVIIQSDCKFLHLQPSSDDLSSRLMNLSDERKIKPISIFVEFRWVERERKKNVERLKCNKRSIYIVYIGHVYFVFSIERHEMHSTINGF